jgi:putative flippase GtrA
MRRLLNRGVQLLADQRARYVIAGGFNVPVNYVVGAAIYQTLLPRLNFVVVGLIVTVVSISISFTTHKLFVFRTAGKWWVEYLKSYIVYGSSSLLSIALMWLLVKRAHVNVWLAQALVTALAVTLSYVGHMAFTFRQTKLPGATSVTR